MPRAEWEGVVLDPPVGHEDLRLQERVELFDGEQFVADAAAVGLDPGVLPGRARLDVAGARAGEAAPVAQGVGCELGPVVAADVLGVRTASTRSTASVNASSAPTRSRRSTPRSSEKWFRVPAGTHTNGGPASSATAATTARAPSPPATPSASGRVPVARQPTPPGSLRAPECPPRSAVLAPARPGPRAPPCPHPRSILRKHGPSKWPVRRRPMTQRRAPRPFERGYPASSARSRHSQLHRARPHATP
jgi:hypothetical protein